MKTLVAHRERPVPAVRDARPDVSKALESVIRRMMERAPEKRFQSMTEVIDALESKETAAPPARRTRWLVSGVAATASLVLFAWMCFSGVIIRQATEDGLLEVYVNQPDALIEVLDKDNTVQISQAGGPGKLMIKVDPGRHRLKISKDGFDFFTRNLTIQDGQTTIVRAELKRQAPRTIRDTVALHEYRLGAGDVLGVYVEGILGGDLSPAVFIPEDRSLAPGVGYPVPVDGDGLIQLPLIPSLNVNNMTLREAANLITRTFM